ncbi:4Fe-4S dicluster domain-containing protein [Chloroflexota bacterium]
MEATTTVSKNDIDAFLEELLEEYEVFAPIKQDDVVSFGSISSAAEVVLDVFNTLEPPKSVLFPQSEPIFTYALSDGVAGIWVPLRQERPRVVFGVRPCDARSFSILDRVFGGEKYQDVYYLNRRANTTVVTIGCNEPRSTCFCTSVGGGPFSTEGTDLLLVDVGDEYAIRIITDKGARLLKAKSIKGATKEQRALIRRIARNAEASMVDTLPVNKLKEKLDNIFYDPAWKDLTEKCLGCGVCTYLCPTCHCFDIVDEATDSGINRIRLWDSCQFSQFTLQTSGFNPRTSTKERLRQRIMHKFSYFPENYGQFGCVGCGRCVTECPANVDIREIIKSVQKQKVAI